MTKGTDQGKKTKQKIYTTAIELITNNGYDHVTVDEICQKAGVAKGTFYVHFKAKEDIIKSIYRENCQKYVNEKMHLDENGIQGTLDELYNYCILSMEFANSTGVDLTALSYTAYLSPAAKNERTFYAESYSANTIKSIIRKCFENNIFKPEYSEEIIIKEIFIVMMGSTISWCLADGDYNLKETAAPVFYNLIYHQYRK
ncbi:MAG: TetR/AcrR family transcriptional regulator [Erysipelotrichaceae bacterium]